MGDADAPGIGARSVGCASAGPPRRATVSAAVTLGGGRRWGEVGAGAVPTCGMSPASGGVAGDVDADFHHQLGFHQRDDKFFLAAPRGGE